MLASCVRCIFWANEAGLAGWAGLASTPRLHLNGRSRVRRYLTKRL
jgi:hypothetical protein